MMASIDDATSNSWRLHGLLASAACTQKVIIKTNQPLWPRHQLTTQQVIHGACHGDATASEQHHLRHSKERFYFFLSLFCVCSNKCGVTSEVLRGMHAKSYNFKKSNCVMMAAADDASSNSWRLPQLCHCKWAMPPSNSAEHFISFFDWFALALTTKHICGATSELQWWHLAEATSVELRCSQKSVRQWHPQAYTQGV